MSDILDGYTEDQLDALTEYIYSNPEHRQALVHREGSLWFPYLAMLSAPDPDLRDRMPPSIVAEAFFGQMLKELPIFALDSDIFISAVTSMMEAADQGMEIDALDLPPLPFESIAIEMAPEAVDWGEAVIAGFVVREEIEGEQWQVITMVGGEHGIDLLITHIRPGYMLAYVQTPGQELEWEHMPHSPIWSSVVQALHLITARGVEHEKLPRPQRREFERKIKRKYPQAFIIKIGTTSAYERGDGSGRALTCRFMVRGHWRHYETKRTWIRPYIKGPADAPWRAPLNPVRKVA